MGLKLAVEPGDGAGEITRLEWFQIFHAFADAGLLGIWDPLPSQQSQFGFASAGAGTRFKVGGHYNGSLDIAIPFISQTNAESGDIRVTFRGWADF